MAKSSKSTRKPKTEAHTPPPPVVPPPAAGPTPQSESLIDQLGDALLNIGSEAKRLGQKGITQVEKYGRLGITRADLEREKLALRSAYANLGEKITQLWDDSPMATVRSGDVEFEEEMKRVKELRRKVAELREKLNTLRTDEAPQS